MYLVTVQQQYLNRDPVLSEIPERKFHLATMKALADWCHGFMRACAAKGWAREAYRDRMRDAMLAPAEIRDALRQHDLAPLIVLNRTDRPYRIALRIEDLSTLNPVQAAAHFAR